MVKSRGRNDGQMGLQEPFFYGRFDACLAVLG